MLYIQELGLKTKAFFLWDRWHREWEWNRLFSEYFSFPRQSYVH